MNPYSQVSGIFCLVGSLVWLSACESKSVETIATETAIAPPPSVRQSPPAKTSEADRLAVSILPVLNGVWIDTRYWDALRRTKSQRAANGQWNSLAITELLIDATTRAADTVRASTVIGNHEGSLLTIVLKSSGDSHALPARMLEDLNKESSQLRYQIAGSDSLLELTRTNQQHRLLSRASFRKVPGLRLRVDSAKALMNGMSYLTNALLFAGHYQGIDSTGASLKVTFTKDGQMLGFPQHRYYDAQNDFSGPYSNLD